ncbi:MAG: phosphoribosylglycinamide formyltransferase [Saprospiraceae bacterium]|nr:phosphoribosylglycinamide formyltransferase [Saprospiraceae bacterium]
MRTPTQAKQLALFASGTGSNVRNLYAYFRDRPDVQIALLVCNRPDAPVVTFARETGIPVRIVSREEWSRPDGLVEELQQAGLTGIVLAGFLWLIPEALIRAFPNRILNLHPALLPKYGGKGMYGMRVHEAVLEAGEKESGITVHYVNGRYDEGAILFQARCPVLSGDTPESLADRIHQLEHQWLPVVIDKLLLLT